MDTCFSVFPFGLSRVVTVFVGYSINYVYKDVLGCKVCDFTFFCFCLVGTN